MSQKTSQATAVLEQFNRLAADLNLYFKKFVEYVQKHHIEQKDDAQSIRQLLEAYLQLAERYYQQFRESLLNKLIALNEDKVALAQAFKAVALLSDFSVKNNIREAKETKEQEYNQLLDQIPLLLQQALSKLAAEWERVYRVLIASRAAREEMKEFMMAITPVMRAANHSVGIDGRDLFVIPQLGSDYALQFFNYADNFMVLSMPIFALKAPWEWSIIWHEMAGYLVRQLKQSEFEVVNLRLAEQAVYKQAFVCACQRLDELTKSKDLLNPVEKELVQHADIIRENMGALLIGGLGLSSADLPSYLDQADDHILDFQMQLQTLQEEVLQKRGSEAFEEFLDYGWSTDWLEELFEDAFSARFFGWPFLSAFSRILKRFEDGGKGLRHPARRLRILTAKKIVELTNFTEGVPLTNLEGLSNLASDFTLEDKATKPVVIWRVQNNTDRTWNKNYGLKFVRGNAFPYRVRYALPKAKPDDIVDIAISLKVPDEPGDYSGEWCLVDEQDAPFGLVNVSFKIDVEEIPLENYMIALVGRRIYRMLNLLARKTHQPQLDMLKEYTDLINNVTATVKPNESRNGYDLEDESAVEEMTTVAMQDNPADMGAAEQIPVKSLPPTKDVTRLWQKKLPAISLDEASRHVAEQTLAIGQIIGEAMKSWVLANNDDEETAVQTIEKLKQYSPSAPSAMGVNAEEPGASESEPDSFLDLIDTMDHNELLGLTFTDVDFNNVNFVTIVQNLKNYKVLAKTWLDWETKTPQRVREVKANDNLTQQVVIIKARKQWRMDINWWNSARGSRPKLIRDA